MTTAHRVLCAFTFASVAACASHGGPRASLALANQDLAKESVIGLAESAGARVRKEHPSGFVVYPRFLTSQEHQIVIPSDSNQSVLVEAFRGGARARYVDSAAVRDSARLVQLPDSARYFYTLSRTPSVVGDTGMVDIYQSVYAKEYSPYEITIFRYRFVWDRAAGWQYQRRVLLYGA